jgi:Domain of unknown function (DUF4397)
MWNLNQTFRDSVGIRHFPQMKISWSGFKLRARRLVVCPRGLTATAALSLLMAFALAGCQNVATYTQPTLVRVIDASYIAPPVNVLVNGVMLAGNIGQGTITPYGTVGASNGAVIKVTAATGGAALVTSNGTLLPGHQHSIFLTDNGAAPGGYQVTVLEDQQTQAAAGHSAFRFLNQAAKIGPVDVYMVPSGTTLANAIPIVTALPVGGTAGYVSFPSETVTMVITPTSLTTPKYASTAMALVGGEVRTVLILDTQLTSNPPVRVFMANDAGPSD